MLVITGSYRARRQSPSGRRTANVAEAIVPTDPPNTFLTFAQAEPPGNGNKGAGFPLDEFKP